MNQCDTNMDTLSSLPVLEVLRRASCLPKSSVPSRSKEEWEQEEQHTRRHLSDALPPYSDTLQSGEDCPTPERRTIDSSPPDTLPLKSCRGSGGSPLLPPVLPTVDELLRGSTVRSTIARRTTTGLRGMDIRSDRVGRRMRSEAPDMPSEKHYTVDENSEESDSSTHCSEGSSAYTESDA